MNWKSVFGAGASALAVWFASGVPTCAFAADTPPSGDLVDLTDTIGSLYAMSAHYNSCDGAFDNDVSGTATADGRWLTAATSAWVTWDFGTPTSVNAYRMMPAYVSYASDKRNPKNFQLLGKNDSPDSTDGWTVIDERSGESMAVTTGVQPSWYYYEANGTPGKYRYVKLDITSNNGDTYTGLQEVELLNVSTPTIVPKEFKMRATFTTSGYAGTEKLENFPVLVRISEEMSGFSYDTCLADGSDIRFADADGKILPHEIDTWNTSGESLIWVSVPSVASDTTFKMYIGGDGSADSYPVSAVWTRANYKFVHHNNVTADTAGSDSAGSGLVGVKCQNALAISSDAGSPLGSCDDQTDSHGWEIANNSYWTGHGEELSMSCWSYREDVSDNSMDRALQGESGKKYYDCIYPSTGIGKVYIGSTAKIAKTFGVNYPDWMHVTAVFDNNTARLYQNGTLYGEASGCASIASPTGKYAVGAKTLTNRNKGYLDEMRFRWGVSSGDWVKAEYDTVMNASFLESTAFTAIEGEDISPEDWDFSFKISLGAEMKSALGSGEETHFPLLVRLSEAGISGFKYGNFTQSDYSDLVFVDADNNFLDYEVDTWDAAGTSLVWVRVPSLLADTEITCRYGGPAYEHKASKAWRNYIGVWHMNEASGNALDATSASRDAVPSKNASAASDADLTAMVGVDGVLGKARVNYLGTNQKGTYLSVPAYSLSTAANFTYSAWYKMKATGGYQRPVSSKKSYSDSYGFEVEFGNNSATAMSSRGASSTAVAATVPDMTAAWVKLLWVYNGTTVTIYANGEQLATGSVTKPTTTYTLSIGSNSDGSEYSWRGWYDEARMYDGLLSAARIKLEYLQESSDAVLTYGAVQAPDMELPVIKGFDVTVNEAGYICVTGRVTRHSGTVTLTFISEEYGSLEFELGEIAANGEFGGVYGYEDDLFNVGYLVKVTAANGDKQTTKTTTDPVWVATPSSQVSFTVTPSAAIKEVLGSTVYADFPVLVRIPEKASAFLRSGNEIKVFDQDGQQLSWEMEEFNPEGVSFLWVKVPSLSSETELTVKVGVDGSGNDPTDVWTNYVGVWHFAPDAAGGTTVADATGHSLDATADGEALAVCDEGPFGGKALSVSGTVAAPDYEPGFDVGNSFTASGWCKCPTYSGSGTKSFASKKKNWNDLNGWYIQVKDKQTQAAVGLDAKVNTFTIPDAIENWNYFTIVSTGSKVQIYMNGSTSTSRNDSYAVVANSQPYKIGFDGNCEDEYRIRKGAAGAVETRLEYLTMADAEFFDYGELIYIEEGVLEIGVPVIASDGAGGFTASVTIDEHMPKEDTVKLYFDGVLTPMTTTDTSVPATYTCAFASPSENTTERARVRALAQSGYLSCGKWSVFYTGVPGIEKIQDATEKGLTNGIFRISRADTAYDLKVNFSVQDSSTAVEGKNYKPFELSTVIPEGTNCVDVIIQPIMDLETDETTHVDVAIAAGQYEVDSAADPAVVNIINYEVPSGGNVWVAKEAGLASVDANWSLGFAPTAANIVIFDGDASTADCEWDTNATFTVAGWQQNSVYTGTVTIDTTYESGEHPRLTVNGDMYVLGGTLTHLANVDGDKVGTYRLKIVTSGVFDLGSEAKIDASLRGFRGNCYPSGSTYGAHAASGDGYSYVYGDVYRPSALGAGGNGDVERSGGGAVWLECGGKAVIDGKINVRGYQGDTQNAACGSVYIKATECTGAGTILADFDKDGYYSGGRGSAGRVAIELTEAKTLGLPGDNVEIDGCCSGSTGGGGGTFFVKTAADEHGTLYLDDTRGKSYGARWQKWKAITAIPQGANWTFDKIVISGWGMLAVPENTGLFLPKGASSVSANSTRQGGIFYNGGIIDFGEERPFRFSGDWIFQANQKYTFDGDVSIGGGAAFGCMRYGGATDFSDFAVCDITVKGELTIDSDGYVYAFAGGPDMNVNRVDKARHGGMSANYGTSNAAYDAIFDPELPGYGLAHGDQATSCAGGGVVRLEVTGTLENNGVMNADGGAYSSDVGAAGGTINITAGDLIGKGSIRARSAQSGNYGNGGGGRIAIRLGEDAACTAKVFNNISACGYTLKSASAANSSAGTIYLYVADGLGIENGTIYVRGDGKSGNDNTFTPIPVGNNSYSVNTETAARLKSASLTIESAATVKLTDTLENATLNIYDNCSLDLNGKVYTVRRAYVNGTKVPVGDYVPGDDPFDTLLTDSAGGGKLHITGYGLWVFVQ